MNATVLVLSGDAARVVFTSSEGLRWVGLGGAEYREPAQRVTGPGPVVGLISNGTLYWVPPRGSIYRYRPCHI